jgi:hypothetical protein
MTCLKEVTSENCMASERRRIFLNSPEAALGDERDDDLFELPNGTWRQRNRLTQEDWRALLWWATERQKLLAAQNDFQARLGRGMKRGESIEDAWGADQVSDLLRNSLTRYFGPLDDVEFDSLSVLLLPLLQSEEA